MSLDGEYVEVQADAATATWLRRCANQRSETVAAATAAQLRQLAVADSVAQHAAWAAANPTYFDDAEAVRHAAAPA